VETTAPGPAPRLGLMPLAALSSDRRLLAAAVLLTGVGLTTL
jgi:hypothetical protein